MGKIVAYVAMPHPPIIIPQVGRGEEKKIKNTYDACESIGREIADLKPEVIIIVTPHGTMFSDAIAVSFEPSIAGSLKQFGAPEVSMNFEIDMDLTQEIMVRADKSNIPIVRATSSTLKTVWKRI